MADFKQEIKSIDNWIHKEKLLLPLALIPIAFLLLTLGVAGCTLSNNLSQNCISTIPVIYAILTVLSFVAAFQLTHYLIEFLEYRSKNKDMNLLKALKISIKHTEKADTSGAIEEIIEPIEKKFEKNKTEDGEEPPVKVMK